VGPTLSSDVTPAHNQAMTMSTTQAAGPAGVRRLRAASWVAWVPWGITAASLIGGILISIVAKTDQSDPFSYIVAPVAVMGYATVGTLIVSRRQGNRIGWYFCALEALQNTAKYSGANRASIRLSSHDGHVVFEFRDDGSGFDLGRTGRGTGLQGMADRLEALGGRLEVTSAPGRGTTVVRRIPVHQRDPG
jgi:hypothetical protein